VGKAIWGQLRTEKRVELAGDGRNHHVNVGKGKEGSNRLSEGEERAWENIDRSARRALGS